MPLRDAVFAAAFAVFAITGQAFAAATELQLWHAMPSELGRQLQRIVANFNGAQSQYRIIPVFK